MWTESEQRLSGRAPGETILRSWLLEISRSTDDASYTEEAEEEDGEDENEEAAEDDDEDEEDLEVAPTNRFVVTIEEPGRRAATSVAPSCSSSSSSSSSSASRSSVEKLNVTSGSLAAFKSCWDEREEEEMAEDERLERYRVSKQHRGHSG